MVCSFKRYTTKRLPFYIPKNGNQYLYCGQNSHCSYGEGESLYSTVEIVPFFVSKHPREMNLRTSLWSDSWFSASAVLNVCNRWSLNTIPSMHALCIFNTIRLNLKSRTYFSTLVNEGTEPFRLSYIIIWLLVADKHYIYCLKYSIYNSFPK